MFSSFQKKVLGEPSGANHGINASETLEFEKVPKNEMLGL